MAGTTGTPLRLCAQKEPIGSTWSYFLLYVRVHRSPWRGSLCAPLFRATCNSKTKLTAARRDAELNIVTVSNQPTYVLRMQLPASLPPIQRTAQETTTRSWRRSKPSQPRNGRLAEEIDEVNTKRVNRAHNQRPKMMVFSETRKGVGRPKEPKRKRKPACRKFVCARQKTNQPIQTRHAP